jgi:hypothetical protein
VQSTSEKSYLVVVVISIAGIIISVVAVVLVVLFVSILVVPAWYVCVCVCE